jgi:DNA-directed RNA polymerase subunit beta'
LSGELIDRFHYEDINAKVLAEGGEPATAHTVLMAITRAALSTNSWLAAASFQETTKVLTDAAIYGRVDKLIGLNENVIIGKMIPARYPAYEEMPEEGVPEEVPELVAGEEDKEELAI